ncbi:MAG: pentapeptide repeat-containing protein [Hyphomicrobiaceae bacterium]|nr:pentapeptide repeat-containing protein [Hyphomicrobiaceae bacterium]
MTDMTRVAPDSETPVNPYSLLEAVNRSSDTAHTAWLIFLAMMTYLMIAVAGVTHTTLLLETPVALPILQVDIPLTQFFQFAPIILVLLHLGLVSQLVLLARKTLEFDHAIRMLEVSDRRLHPLRLELHNFFFVQAIAGPHRSAVMSGFLHGMSWLTLVVLPLVLILYIQVMFLPYHDTTITWTHRAALLVDVAMLILIGVFMTRAETSFFQAFWRTTATHPVSFLVTTMVVGMVTLFSFLVATIPGEKLDTLGRSLLARAEGDRAQRDGTYKGFVLGFLDTAADGSMFGIFHRNLVVADADLVSDKEVSAGEPTLNLRGRDLRYAVLDRSDMHQADLTGADLSDASLDGTDLRNALLHCSDVNELILSEDRRRAFCTIARGADFSRAKLMGARMTGIDARDARFEDARMEGAELPHSLLAGASFTGARLDKADLTGGVQAQGANFAIASLQGADLKGARLYGADFRSATMQAAILDYARLEGANFQGADLEAASLYRARLQAADFTRVRLIAADLRGAAVWMAQPAEGAQVRLADLDGLVVRKLTEAETTSLKESILSIGSDWLRRQVGDRLSALIDQSKMAAWEGSADSRSWDVLVRSARSTFSTSSPVSPLAGVSSDPNATPVAPAPVAVDYTTSTYSRELTGHLVGMLCRPRWSNGAVASGIAVRAQAPQFAADLAAINARLADPTCKPAPGVAERIRAGLSSAADIAAGR